MVIAIVGVLLSLLSPSLNNVISAAHSNKCFANLRQVSLITQSYISDYQDNYPTVWSINPSSNPVQPSHDDFYPELSSGQWGGMSFMLLVQAYDEGLEISEWDRVWNFRPGNTVFICPSDMDPRINVNPTATPLNFPICRKDISYAVNSAAWAGIQTNGNWHGQAYFRKILPAHTVKSPSQSILMLDHNKGYASANIAFTKLFAHIKNFSLATDLYNQLSFNGLYLRHQNFVMSNSIFFDGHAEGINYLDYHNSLVAEWHK